MSTTSPVQSSVGTSPATGGVCNTITSYGTYLIDLVKRVFAFVIGIFKGVLDKIAELTCLGFDNVHMWITGIPSVTVSATARGGMQRTAPTSRTAAPISQQSSTELTPDEQRQLLQMTNSSGSSVRPPIPPTRAGGDVASIQDVSRGMSVEDQFVALQMQQLQENQAREAAQRNEAQLLAERLSRKVGSEVIVPSTEHEPTGSSTVPLIEAGPQKLQIPEELVPLLEQNKDGIAFMRDSFPNLINKDVPDVKAILQPAAEEVAQFFTNPDYDLSTTVPRFLQEPVSKLPGAVTLIELLNSCRRAIVDAKGAAVKGMETRIAILINRLISQDAFKACVYGACVSE